MQDITALSIDLELLNTALRSFIELILPIFNIVCSAIINIKNLKSKVKLLKITWNTRSKKKRNTESHIINYGKVVSIIRGKRLSMGKETKIFLGGLFFLILFFAYVGLFVGMENQRKALQEFIQNNPCKCYCEGENK